jgi:hypothetical protein
MVVLSGTTVDVYPARRADFDIPVANADVNPSILEYKLKGPVFAPAVVNVITTVII